MAPSKTTVIAQGSPVVIHLTGLELDQAPASQTPQLSVTYFNVPGVTTGKASWVANFSVAVQNPPAGDADLTQVLAVTLESNQVVNSYDSPTTTANTLTLMFSQTPAGVGVPAGAGTLFTVSFVYGQDGDPFGYGALTTVASARDIKPAKGDNADEWVPTSNTSAESPNWTLKPPTGQPIAGTGVDAVTSFTFAPIVTTYQPGPTVMLVQYQGVPGYRGGVYTLVLDKLPHVVVGPVTVTPPVTYLHEGQADVTVKWDVSYAKQLQLTQNFQPFDVTGTTSKLVTLTTQMTSFRLDATGLGTNVDNQASGSARASRCRSSTPSPANRPTSTPAPAPTTSTWPGPWTQPERWRYQHGRRHLRLRLRRDREHLGHGPQAPAGHPGAGGRPGGDGTEPAAWSSTPSRRRSRTTHSPPPPAPRPPHPPRRSSRSPTPPTARWSSSTRSSSPP